MYVVVCVVIGGDGGGLSGEGVVSACRSVPGVGWVVGHVWVCVRRMFTVVMCFWASRSIVSLGTVGRSSIFSSVGCVMAVHGIALSPLSMMAAAGCCGVQCW